MPNSGDTVLVVEDEALIRWNIVDALEEAGFEVLEASMSLKPSQSLARFPISRRFSPMSTCQARKTDWVWRTW